MARFSNETQASADGIRIVHEPERHRYAVYRQQDGVEQELGEAHYSFIGDDIIDFDHTLVRPELRGTGVAALLAQRALTGEAIQHRSIRASCSYIEGYLARHPEILNR